MKIKNNIRSIRFSDELAELIDRQQGRNFTEKLETLITRCAWELPAKEEELAQLEQRIEEKRRQLREMTAKAGELHMSLSDLTHRTSELEAGIQRAIKKWDA